MPSLGTRIVVTVGAPAKAVGDAMLSVTANVARTGAITNLLSTAIVLLLLVARSLLRHELHLALRAGARPVGHDLRVHRARVERRGRRRRRGGRAVLTVAAPVLAVARPPLVEPELRGRCGHGDRGQAVGV